MSKSDKIIEKNINKDDDVEETSYCHKSAYSESDKNEDYLSNQEYIPGKTFNDDLDEFKKKKEYTNLKLNENEISKDNISSKEIEDNLKIDLTQNNISSESESKGNSVEKDNLNSKSSTMSNIHFKKRSENIKKKETIRNGCCRDCMKAFNKQGKSCLCQVPKKERKHSLNEKGCNFCGCFGCNPGDLMRKNRRERKKQYFEDEDLLFKRQRLLDSEDEDVPTNLKDSDEYNKYRQEFESLLLKYVKDFSGLGFPKRTSSYIFGYNPKEDLLEDLLRDEEVYKKKKTELSSGKVEEKQSTEKYLASERVDKARKVDKKI